MNKLERMIDRLSPTLSVRLRYLKYRLHGHGALAVLPRFVKRGDVVVDVGANRGVYTYRLEQLVGRHGSVHAFEPVPTNVRILERLFDRRRNVMVHPVALSDHPGLSEIYVPLYDGHQVDALASLVLPKVQHESVLVRLLTLDDVMLHVGRPVSFIKCDVEGAELSVLRGSEALLKRYHPTVLIEIEQRHQANDISLTFDYLHDLGYAGYFIDACALRPINEFDVHEHQLNFLGEDFVPYGVPKGYISDFVFVSGHSATSVLAPSLASVF